MSLSLKKGLFISVEGPDCVGKSTVINELKNIVSFNQYNGVIFTREPGGTSFAEQLRNILLNSDQLALDSLTSALLFISGRVDHLNKTILPALKENKIVIVDRYVDSTAIYQGYLKNEPIEKIYNLNNIATNNILPDITFYLRADIETIKQRSNGRHIDSFDKYYLTKIEQMIEGFDLLANKFPNRIKIIDATKTPLEIASDILAHIQNYVK